VYAGVRYLGAGELELVLECDRRMLYVLQRRAVLGIEVLSEFALSCHALCLHLVFPTTALLGSVLLL